MSAQGHTSGDRISIAEGLTVTLIGDSTIAYTVGGVSIVYTVTIEASGLPSTGQNFIWVWVMAGLAGMALTGVGWTYMRKRAQRA